MPDVEPIAIVGAGIRFPGGNESLDDFADFLRRGGNAISPVPEDRWDNAAFTSDDPEARGKIRAAGFGFLNQIDQFDAPFFGVSPLEAQYTDPQQRLLLEVAWEALENANIDYESLRHGNGGVYIGASCIDFALELDALPYEDLDGHLAAGITMFPMSGRLSYFLGWQGPSLTTDTACASSLTALHLAAEGLRNGECEIALAGGVAAIHHPRIPVMFTHGGMLAPDGQCKTFDDSANGYVRSEGCGVLVLKRLSVAERHGDRIIGVVRGTAIGQDGASAGLTVPNGTAQERVMNAALRAAGAQPGDVQYVEAHGTGTALGDPIEMGAIVDVFGASHTAEQPLVVSSVKTNVGHMEPVAGIGGMMKVLLQMREQSFFPHLNMTKPSGRIPWDRIPVSVPTKLRPWEAPTRRAVINSFGFGGAIAAAVVEEPAAAGRPVPPPALGAAVFTLSAKSKRSLAALLRRYRDHLAAHPELTVEDVCYTGNVGRTHLPLRVAGVVTDRTALDRLLERELERVDKAAGSAGRRKVAFLFAGQGAQYPGMGAALYEQFPVFRNQVDACDTLFAGPLGTSVRDLMFGDDADVLRQTRYTQAALFTLEYALAKLWLSWGIRPTVLIGHSIGEVTAAVVAGLFTLGDAVRLVAARGRLMQSVTAVGGMAAVDAPAGDITPLLARYPGLALAAMNSPAQTVVSGTADELDQLCATLEAQGRKVTRLAVSHAFHSPLMRQVYDDFRAELDGIAFHEPELTLVSNLTGKVARFSELSDVEYWVRHIGEPVDFLAGMGTIEKRGTHAFIEIGPGRSLTAPARQCVDAAKHLWLSSLDRTDADGDVIREAVVQYYRAGGSVSWPGFHADRERTKVELPTYAFDRKRYWLPVKGPRHGVGGVRAGGRVHHPLLGAEVEVAGGVREFRARWSAGAPAYLADHVVMSRVVMPGTGYLEALLALQDAVFGETGRPITDVRILEPLFLPEDGDTDVRVRLRGGTRAEIVSLVDGVERTHLKAVIGESVGESRLTDAGEALLATAAGIARDAVRPDEVVDADTVYRLYAGAGLEYGPQFRRMGDVSRYGTEFATGEVSVADPDAAEHVPPFVVDAATHAFAAVGNDGNNYLPVRYTSFRMFKKPKANRLRVLLRLDPDPVPEVDIAIDLVALEDDRPVFELRGLGMKRVAGNGARRELAHDLRWLRRSLVGAGDDRHTVLAVRAPEACRAALPGASFTADEGQVATLLTEAVTDVCWFWDEGGDLAAESERNYRRLLELLRVLGKASFGRDQRLWLVTRRGQHMPGDDPDLSRAPASASLWGFGHTLLNEHPAYRTTMVDLPGVEAGYASLAEEIQASVAGEFQIGYRDGRRYVRRLVPLELGITGPDDTFALTMREYGQFAGVQRVPAERVAPIGDEVEILVRAAGLNFKDVLNALGLLKEFGEQPLGFEAAGTVIAAGPEATHRVGDDVVVNYLGCMARHLVAPSAVMVPKPPQLDFAEAAALPAAYVTAHYALHTLAGINAGDRILIHAAAGGVGQAAVQLAKAAGAEIHATASPHKWPLLREQGVTHVYNSRTLDFASQLSEQTGGNGVDIVLNSLNKDYIPASMSCLGQGGRFVEMGKVGAWTPEQVRAERPDVTYHNFDLSELPWDDAVRVTAETMTLVIGQVADGTLAPLRTSVYSLEEIEEAFGVLSRGTNVGKLVLDFDGPVRGPEIPIRDDRTYVITGGLGALGVVTARALVAAGARHIALTGRGDSPAPDVAADFERLCRDAQVRVIRGDIAEAADVTRILAEAAADGHPVGGIVHSAGTLQDAPVTALSWETIEPVFRAKVYGTWLLHQAAATLPELEFLVGYSSAAPVVGTPGQANYAAANAFLDDVLVRRFAAGRPGMSVNWGPWGEVGMSARLADVLYKRWADEGIVLTTPAVGMRALRALLHRPAGQAVVGECDWDRFADGKAVVNAVYQRLLSAGGDAGADRPDLAQLAATPRDERLGKIDGFVRSRVAAVLHFDDADAVDSTTEFVRLGLDSLVAVELKNSLEVAFGIPLPSTVALEYPSADLLADFIDRQLFPEPAAV